MRFFSRLCSSSSHVAKGRHYEQQVVHSLSRLGFELRSTGGCGDGGVDFRGSWTLCSFSHPLLVVGQCKALANKVSVQVIREMEGALCHEQQGTLGIVASKTGFSVASRTFCQLSKFPLLLVGFHPFFQHRLAEFWMNESLRCLVPDVKIGISFCRIETQLFRCIEVFDRNEKLTCS
eukprot:jgi/Galph1/3641/GphlegSOOS_G2274.1